MAKRWKKEEVTYLKRYAKKRRTEELATRFRTNTEEVNRKLAELGLKALDSGLPEPPKPDPLIPVYERGLKALYKEKWREAAKLFEKVAQETTERDLAERARRYVGVCHEHLATRKAGSDEDPFLLAVYERNRGNLEEALALCSRGGRQSKDERFAYLAASLHSLSGDHEKAAKFLSLAIEMNPRNRVHAHYDPDFDELRDSPDYQHLFD
jgi:tetratricopeptide (TPR) repeat protein